MKPPTRKFVNERTKYNTRLCRALKCTAPVIKTTQTSSSRPQNIMNDFRVITMRVN